MPKCNMDCLNCIYDDCILDKGYTTTTTRYDAREYHRLYRRYMYYARHDFYLEYERKRCELKRKLLLTKNKKHTLSKEEKNHINLINKKYKNKKKKSNYTNWYNKYLEFDNKPLLENPYRILTLEERTEKSKREFFDFRKENGIGKNRKKYKVDKENTCVKKDTTIKEPKISQSKNSQELKKVSDLEKSLIKEANISKSKKSISDFWFIRTNRKNYN